MNRVICAKVASSRWDSRSENRYPESISVEMADACRIEYRRVTRMPGPVLREQDHAERMCVGYPMKNPRSG